MRHLLAPAALGLVLLAPALAQADVDPGPSPGCGRCSVDGSAGTGLVALTLAGIGGLALRRGGRRRHD